MRPHTLDEMSTIILIFCRDGANKIELIEKCYLNDIEFHFPRPHWLPSTFSSHILPLFGDSYNISFHYLKFLICDFSQILPIC